MNTHMRTHTTRIHTCTQHMNTHIHPCAHTTYIHTCTQHEHTHHIYTPMCARIACTCAHTHRTRSVNRTAAWSSEASTPGWKLQEAGAETRLRCGVGVGMAGAQPGQDCPPVKVGAPRAHSSAGLYPPPQERRLPWAPGSEWAPGCGPRRGAVTPGAAWPHHPHRCLCVQLPSPGRTLTLGVGPTCPAGPVLPSFQHEEVPRGVGLGSGPSTRLCSPQDAARGGPLPLRTG